MYTHVYNHDNEYLSAKDHQDAHINSGAHARAEHVYDEYERDIDTLQETIWNLEDENEYLKEELDS
jgi:hypothetical protein